MKLTDHTFACSSLTNFEYKGHAMTGNWSFTGKSLSEVFIYLSINPQYDNRLFNDLQVQYKKIKRVEHVKNILFTQIV